MQDADKFRGDYEVGVSSRPPSCLCLFVASVRCVGLTAHVFIRSPYDCAPLMDACVLTRRYCDSTACSDDVLPRSRTRSSMASVSTATIPLTKTTTAVAAGATTTNGCAIVRAWEALRAF